ncbi:MAG: nucleotidyltransferase domain-containing protein [Candidatus Thorarchaeota archaeon]|nr:nucleotidyltransferase domain-containing protein [Candidatus Thorarchaeota archaeon]
MNLEIIRSDLEELSDRDVLIFGSYVTGEFREGSDIDIAVLAHTEDREEMKNLKLQLLSAVPEGYDLSILEALPTVVKAGVLKNYEVLFGDPPEIGEYLRKYWKEWEDYKHRLELPTVQEMRKSHLE